MTFAHALAGTSCSCPTFSAVVALLNELRINAGKAPLGFLNPLIYANPQAFNVRSRPAALAAAASAVLIASPPPPAHAQDITKGSNPGCSTQGFPASKGWDPVTGMGTVRAGPRRRRGASPHFGGSLPPRRIAARLRQAGPGRHGASVIAPRALTELRSFLVRCSSL